MPGLFDPPQQGGLFGNIGAGLASFANSGALFPGISNMIGGFATGHRQDPQGMAQELFQEQVRSLAQMPEFQGPGGLAKALAVIQNPALQSYQFKELPQQHQLEQTLTPTLGPQGAALGSQQPSLLGPLFKPEKLDPGGSLVSPMQFPGMGGGGGGGGGAPSIASADAALAGGGGGGAPAAAGGPNVIASNTNGMMPPEAIEDMVSRRLVGDTSVEKNFGGMGPLGKLNQAAYQKRLSQVMKDRGISPQELVANTAKFPAYEGQLKRLATIDANMGTARMEFEPIWNAFKQAMGQVNGQFPSWNALKQFALKHAGDPRVAPLAQYTQALENVYGRAISTNPQGPTVHDKTRSEQSLNTFWNGKSLQEIEGALRTEMDAAKNSIPKMRNKADVEQGLGRAASPDILAQARDALKRGAPKDRIIDRLSEQGLKADGL
jgi:hypothetical protein